MARVNVSLPDGLSVLGRLQRARAGRPFGRLVAGEAPGVALPQWRPRG